SQEERPRTMPAAARAARAREAAVKAAKAAEALRLNPDANQPSVKTVKRAEVNAKRIARERAVIAEIQSRPAGNAV
ncbi:hypothetical protein FBU31_006602, partial [Coemansia sp. 'formosensis']